MQKCTVSMLLTTGKQIQFYESFLLQYSLVISSNLIIFELIESSTEGQITALFEKYHGQINDHKNAPFTAMMLESNAPQANELRGLLLDKFFLSIAKDGKKTAKFILSSFINAKEFLLIYAVFEGVMKTEFVRCGVLGEGKYLKEKDIVTSIKSKLGAKENRFVEQLSTRSPLQQFKDVECFWEFFTHFRHLYAHSGGQVTARWLCEFQKKKERIIAVIEEFKCQISAIGLIDAIEKLELSQGKMFYINDSFSNIFRNFVILIMESLYLVEDV